MIRSKAPSHKRDKHLTTKASNEMADYIIISAPDCKWCDKAKAQLTLKDLSFIELSVESPLIRHLWKEMGFKTVPQVFKGPNHIGGYEDLVRHLNS